MIGRKGGRLLIAVLAVVGSMVAACGPVPHPFVAHSSDPLVDDRRVTSAVQVAAPAQFPGLAEAVVKDLAQYDVLASTHAASRRTVLVKGGIEQGNLVWRATTPDRHELGVLSQAIPPGADIPSLAQGATPLIVQLLTASGVAPDNANRPHVAVRPVRGPTGIDTRPLSQALADVLAGKGLAMGGDHPALEIDGEMRVLPGGGGEDVVQMDWIVRDAKGVSLGTISQGSPVERSLLAKPLDSLARDIATAAAPGILEVIRKKSPAALSGG
jgi:hypothetical protein